MLIADNANDALRPEAPNIERRLQTIQRTVREILVARLGVRPEAFPTDEPDPLLLGQGVGLDSVEAMTLATELETAFGIRFEDAELTLDLFRSLGTLVAAVEAKLADGGPA